MGGAILRPFPNSRFGLLLAGSLFGIENTQVKDTAEDYMTVLKLEWMLVSVTR